MAPKKPIPEKPRPPPPEPEEVESSSSEEGSEEEEEEEESEIEEEKNKPKTTPQIQQPKSQVNKNSNAQKQTTPPPQAPSDSGEDEEEEEGEEEAPHSPSASDFTIKAISPPKPSSKDSKPISKRPSEAPKDDKKDSRSKKKAKLNADELKKDKPSASVGAGRVWSDEDIIGLLQTMIDFKNEKGVDYSADMVAFYEFIKGKLQVEFSKTQIYEKIRRLRNKFFNYMEKSEKDGEDPVLSKPHETQVFDLSKRIWGGGHGDRSIVTRENVNGKGSSDDGKAKKSGKVISSVDSAKEVKNKKNVAEEVVRDDDKGDDIGNFGSRYPFLSQSFDDIFLKENINLKESMSLIGDAKAKELEGKWKKLRQAETEVLLEMLDIRKEYAMLVLEGMKEK